MYIAGYFNTFVSVLLDQASRKAVRIYLVSICQSIFQKIEAEGAYLTQ